MSVSGKRKKNQNSEAVQPVADLGGVPPAPPLYGSKFSQFLKFGKIICWCPPPWRVGAPSYGESWIRPWQLYMDLKENVMNPFHIVMFFIIRNFFGFLYHNFCQINQRYQINSFLRCSAYRHINIKLICALLDLGADAVMPACPPWTKFS